MRSHQVARMALMRGKLIAGITPLAAAISHTTSRATMNATPSQRLSHSTASRRRGLPAGAATPEVRWPRYRSCRLRRDQPFVGEELRKQPAAIVQVLRQRAGGD